MKGQAAIEYMVIIGIALLILTPILYYSGKSFSNYKEDTNILSARNTVEKIGENADWICAQGSPARVQINVHMPEDIIEASLENRTVLLRIESTSGAKEVFYESVCDLQGELPVKEGFYYLALVAVDNYVNITVA